MLHEWAILPGTYRPDPAVMLDFNIFTFNSKVFPAIDNLVVKTGDRVRIRIANLSMDEHPIHIHGHAFKVTATDGGRFPLVYPIRPVCCGSLSICCVSAVFESRTREQYNIVVRQRDHPLYSKRGEFCTTDLVVLAKGPGVRLDLRRPLLARLQILFMHISKWRPRRRRFLLRRMATFRLTRK